MNLDIKVVYRKDGDFGDECGIVINNKIVLLDNTFDNTLGECDMTLEKYLSLDLSEQIKSQLCTLIDCYYYNSDTEMGELYNGIKKADINDYETIETGTICSDVIKNMVREVSNAYSSKIATEIISKMGLA